MELTLTSEERDLLVSILVERQRELLREIARAEHHQFRAGLRNSEQLLETMIGKLGTAPAETSPAVRIAS